jgi:predicted RNase H-like HicB family nuclease
MDGITGTFARIMRLFNSDANLSAMKKFHIHAVLFKDADWWCAQCLEYDIATQAKSVEAVKAELEHTLTIHMELAAKRGREPFAGLPQAPQRYFDMYHTSERVNGVKHGATIRTPKGSDSIVRAFAAQFDYSVNGSQLVPN